MPSIDINLNLPQTPQLDDPKYFNEFRRLYAALNNLAAYVNTLNNNVSALTAHRGAATLVGGTVTVSNSFVAAGSLIFITTQVLGTVVVPKAIAVTNRTPGTSFTITSADPTDTSQVAWQFI